MKTFAPKDFAMSMVRSAEPESTTMISPFPSATSGCTLASVRPMFVSSLCVMITTERITMISRYPKRAGRTAPRRQANTGLDGDCDGGADEQAGAAFAGYLRALRNGPAVLPGLRRQQLFHEEAGPGGAEGADGRGIGAACGRGGDRAGGDGDDRRLRCGCTDGAELRRMGDWMHLRTGPAQSCGGETGCAGGEVDRLGEDN